MKIKDNLITDHPLVCENLDGVIDASIDFEPIHLLAITIKPAFTSYITKCKKDLGFLKRKYNDILSLDGVVALESKLEFDTKNVPHVHATLACKMQRPEIISRGWHIYLVPVYDLDRWSSYINKKQPKQEYSFIDE